MHWAQFRKPAKILCYRLINLIFEYIRNNKGAKFQIFFVPDIVIRDFLFWIQYSQFFRRVSMKSILNQPSITITGSTDACNEGGGFVIGDRFSLYEFKDEINMDGINHRKMHINLQEAQAVISLLYNYRETLSGKQLLLYIDNTSVLYSLFKHWSGSVELMEFIQEAVLIMCKYCIGLRVEFIPTSMNGLSDTLSRGKLEEFYQIVDAFGLQMNPQPFETVYYDSLHMLKGREHLLN